MGPGRQAHQHCVVFFDFHGGQQHGGQKEQHKQGCKRVYSNIPLEGPGWIPYPEILDNPEISGITGKYRVPGHVTPEIINTLYKLIRSLYFIAYVDEKTIFCDPHY